MKTTTLRRAAGILAGGAAVAAATYGAYAGLAWLRFGHAPVPRPRRGETDRTLDRFMPLYDIVERHRIFVKAPPAVTLHCACALDAFNTPLASALFRAREFFMGAEPSRIDLPRGLFDAVLAIGWGVLAETPDREIVFGAVTRPWEARPAFRRTPPEDFRSFSDPGYVKIAWTLRADPAGERGSIFRTETRAVATDNESRVLFRRYWALVSPGVALVRLGLLGPVKHAAERQAGFCLILSFI